MMVAKQLTVANDFHSIYILYMFFIYSVFQLFGCQQSSRYLLLCSTEESKSYRFGTSYLRVSKWQNVILPSTVQPTFFGWTIPLRGTLAVSFSNACRNLSQKDDFFVLLVQSCCFAVSVLGFGIFPLLHCPCWALTSCSFSLLAPSCGFVKYSHADYVFVTLKNEVAHSFIGYRYSFKSLM